MDRCPAANGWRSSSRSFLRRTPALLHKRLWLEDHGVSQMSEGVHATETAGSSCLRKLMCCGARWEAPLALNPRMEKSTFGSGRAIPARFGALMSGPFSLEGGCPSESRPRAELVASCVENIGGGCAGVVGYRAVECPARGSPSLDCGDLLHLDRITAEGLLPSPWFFGECGTGAGGSRAGIALRMMRAGSLNAGHQGIGKQVARDAHRFGARSAIRPATPTLRFLDTLKTGIRGRVRLDTKNAWTMPNVVFQSCVSVADHRLQRHSCE